MASDQVDRHMGTTSEPWRMEKSLHNGWGPADLPPDHRGSESTFRLSGDEDVVTQPATALTAEEAGGKHGQPGELALAPLLDPVLEDWLVDLGLGDEVKYKMAVEGITCGSLSLLSHAQLQELGVIKMGDRVKVRPTLAAMKNVNRMGSARQTNKTMAC